MLGALNHPDLLENADGVGAIPARPSADDPTSLLKIAIERIIALP